MEIVQGSINFVDGKTSLNNGVNPTSIENVSDKEVSMCLMVNTSTIISRKMRPKLLCPMVDKEVVVPRVIRVDEEEVFIEEFLIDGGSLSIGGKGCNEFVEDKIFLAFGSREL
jgi:hypothetical protein